MHAESREVHTRVDVDTAFSALVQALYRIDCRCIFGVSFDSTLWTQFFVYLVFDGHGEW